MSITYKVGVNQYDSYTQYPDLFFKFGDEVVKANKCILANYSEYFRALIERNCRDAVDITRETFHEKNTIKITTVSKKIFEFIVKSIYADILSSDKIEDHHFSDEEAYEMISFAHSILINTQEERNLINKICQGYAEQTKNITNLSRLSTYSFGRDYIYEIQKLINSGEASHIESLEKNDISSLLEDIELKEILMLDSSLIRYVNLNDLSKDDILSNFDALSSIYEKPKLVDIICTDLHPEVFDIGRKYIIGYRLFSDAPKISPTPFPRRPQLILVDSEKRVYLEERSSLLIYYPNPVSVKVMGLYINQKLIKVPQEYKPYIEALQMTIDDSKAEEIGDTIYPPPPNLKGCIAQLPIFPGQKILDSECQIYTIESYKEEIIKTTCGRFLTKLEKIYYIPHKLELHEIHQT